MPTGVSTLPVADTSNDYSVYNGASLANRWMLQLPIPKYKVLSYKFGVVLYDFYPSELD